MPLILTAFIDYGYSPRSVGELLMKLSSLGDGPGFRPEPINLHQYAAISGDHAPLSPPPINPLRPKARPVPEAGLSTLLGE
jgi:hypothetical protein